MAKRTTVTSERRVAAALRCLCQQKGFKYTPMNMRFLCEEFDNKGPVTSFLMRLDCLRLYACQCTCTCVRMCVCVQKLKRFLPCCPTYSNTVNYRGNGE